MNRSRLTLPIEGIAQCVNDGRWEQTEDILPKLRQYAMKSTVADLDLQSEHAELTMNLLLAVHKQQPRQRARLVETAKGLTRSKPWEEVLQSQPLLLQRQSASSAPQPQAAVLESPASADHQDSCETPATTQSLATVLESGASANHQDSCETPATTQAVATLEEPAELDQSVVQAAPPQLFLPSSASAQVLNPYDDKPSPETAQEVAKPWDGELAAGPVPMKLLSIPVEEEFEAAVSGVVAIDSHTSFENWAITAFAKLRKAVLHAGQKPAAEMLAVLDGQVEHAASVVTHLLDIERLSPIRCPQVCEVMSILLQSPSWQASVRRSPALVERIGHHDTPSQLRELWRQAQQPQRKTKGAFMDKAKKGFKCWILGCGQKSGQGASSPSNKRGGA